MAFLEAIGGILLIGVVLNDVFNTVILPRPSPARYRPAGLLTRWSWRLWRRYADTQRTPERREQRLGIFAPAVVMLLLGLWIVLLIAGFGLVFDSIAPEISPRPGDLWTALYFAAISLLTVGYGDFVPTQALARVAAVAAGAVGLGIVALTITYLFSLYANFQKRELRVLTLDARAGAPPSGIALLETCASFGDGELRRVLQEWEVWSAEVLESHLAYPILMFFRSTHDHESWVSAIGAILDAATLALTAVSGAETGQARATRGIGTHLVEDIARFFGVIGRVAVESGPGIERVEFDDARGRLAAAGYTLVADPDAAWIEFARLRAEYAGPLNTLARYLDVPPAQWIGDRSYVRH